MTARDQLGGDEERFHVDSKLIAELYHVASTFDRDGLPSTANLLRRAATRIEKLSRRRKP